MLARLSISALVVASLVAPALAQAPPLTIRKRNPLEGSRYMTPGGLPSWVTAQNIGAQAWSFNANFRGPLPERNFMPGRPQPLFEFSTPRD